MALSQFKRSVLGYTLGVLGIILMLPASAWTAPILYDFTLMIGASTITGSFTSMESDNWNAGNIDALTFQVPTALDVNATLFNTVGFDSGVVGHSFSGFNANLSSGISGIAATITTLDFTQTWSYTPNEIKTTNAVLATGGVSGSTIPIGPRPKSTTITPAAVPVPTTWVLFGSGLLGLAGYRWQQRRREGTQVG